MKNIDVIFFWVGEETQFFFNKAVVYVYVSRAPAALPESGGGLICHESAGTNYRQALSDRTPYNRDNPGLVMKPPAGCWAQPPNFPHLPNIQLWDIALVFSPSFQ